MIKHYYTYDDLVVLLSCSKRTLERKLSTMNIRKRYFGGKGKPYFLVVDIHAFMLFNKPFHSCTRKEAQEVNKVAYHAV